MTVSHKISALDAGSAMIMNALVVVKGFRRDNAKKPS